MRKQTVRERLLASTMICGVAMAAFAAAPAYAQEEAAEVEEIVVTGSRIARQDYVANSPITTVTGEATVANADITLDTYLNNLPQVNPAGTTTSNNPGNGGQSNIDLRGFGANRNIVLVDGRRAMPSANNLTVDINTIPQALVDRIEVITGGAGATYGADAIAGAVNVILKNNFEGIDVRGSYGNSTEYWDAEEYQFQAVLGGNFADGKGNAVIAFDRSFRQPIIKSQRDFAKFATSTTSFLPEGALFWRGNGSGGNEFSEAAIDALFATYGVAAGDVTANSGRFGFNMDGTLFYAGLFNSPMDVQNFKYAIDDSVNQALFPDMYSYNFDAVNILVLPLDRYSFMGKTRYEFDNGVEVFAQMGWTEYNSTTALAPTPIPTVNGQGPGGTNNTSYTSSLINVGSTVSQQLVVPVTNPFISSDLAFLLASRTGDDTRLVGSGATEAFTMRQRTLDVGLRQSVYENTVVQFLAGARGNVFSSDWKWEAYISEGRTEIDQTQTGNVDTQRLQNLLEAADGGDSICAGGFNPFGRNPISVECQNYLEVSTTLSTEMTQQVAQAFVSGDVVELPAGPLSVVLGAEYRGFEYKFDPGAAGGPISGFNTQSPDAGTNSFKDVFAEALIPLVKDLPYAQSLDLNIGWRASTSEFHDKIQDLESEARTSHAYKADLNWEMNDYLRGRLSYQRSVRAPNFAELFAGGGSAPQYFDPCSVTSAARNGPNAAQVTALCLATGVSAGGIGTYVQNPGGQTGLDLAGNTDLRPEEGTTITAGLTFSSPWDAPLLSNLKGSIDYWNIKVDNAILTPTPNQIVAACYNYYGTNPTYSASDQNCQALFRAGGDVLWLYDPTTSDGVFQAKNGGHQNGKGIDFQVDWAFDSEDLGLAGLGSFRTNLLLTHVLEWKQQDPIQGVPELDFAGTISYFGAGLGTSFPKWKAVWNANWQINDMFDVSARARYIGAMDNRLDVEFPGEPEFTGVDAITYWDFSGGWAVTDSAEIRIGVNNAFNEEPQLYAPNVQSGTDPSTYDVVGRRVFAQFRLRY